MPDEVANRRRQKLRESHWRKHGREPSAERLAWCDWSIVVTDLSGEKLSVPEAIVLYRSRWQIELLFKRWKSQDRVGLLDGSRSVRSMVRLWSRLLAAVVQHGLVVSCAWADNLRSGSKVAEAIRDLVSRLIVADAVAELMAVIQDLQRIVASTCRRNPRSQPGTLELLKDVSRLDFRLT